MTSLTIVVPGKVREDSERYRGSLVSRKPPSRRSASQGLNSSRSHSLSARTRNGEQIASIIAACRFRPCLQSEAEGNPSPITFLSEKSVRICQSNEYLEVTLDRMFRPSASQEDVFAFIGRSVVADVLEGYNGTIFAYGQTGSGKTYTMIGADLEESSTFGLIPRCSAYLLSQVPQHTPVYCSMVEIYREKLIDLLDSNPKQLKIKESVESGVYIQGLSQVSVSSEQQVLSLLRLGTELRTVAATVHNRLSSRSHAIFTLKIQREGTPSSLNLVDLAGSERLTTFQVSNSIIEDAKKINLSLSVLGSVICALAIRADHIPYRDSKLTRVLQESLGGNCKTHVIVNCSPSTVCIEETIMSLRFAQRTKRVKHEVFVNSGLAQTQVLQSQIKLLETELRGTKEELQRVKEKSTDITLGIPPITPRRYRFKEREGSPSSFDYSSTYRVLTETVEDYSFDSGRKPLARSPVDNTVSFSPEPHQAALLLEGDLFKQRDVLETIIKKQQREITEIRQERDEYRNTTKTYSEKLKQTTLKLKAYKIRQESDAEKRKLLLLKISSDEALAAHMKTRIGSLSKQVHILTQALEELQGNLISSFGTYSELKENQREVNWELEKMSPRHTTEPVKWQCASWQLAALELKYSIKEDLCRIQSSQTLGLETAVDKMRHSNTRLRNELLLTHKELTELKFAQCSKSQICDFIDSQETESRDNSEFPRFSFAEGFSNIEYITRKLKVAEQELEDKQKESKQLMTALEQSKAANECLRLLIAQLERENGQLKDWSRVRKPHQCISGDTQPPEEI